jgi:uncharacterized membrane protein
VIVLVTTERLPPVLATHFDAMGTPNAWSSHETYLLLMAVIGLLIPLGIQAMVAWVGARHPEWLNVPARDYWLEPARRAEGVRRVRSHMWWLACLMTGLAIGIHLLLVQAHESTPPRLQLMPFVGVLGAFLTGIAIWIGAFYRVMRPL